MLERFRPKDIKNRTRDFFHEHKSPILKDHLPLTGTIVSLSIAAAEQDVRLGAITAATYIGYEKTKNKIHDALENSREKRRRKKAFDSFPEGLKEELIQNDTGILINNEEHFFSQYADNFMPTLLATDYFGVAKINENEETQQEEPEGDTDETSTGQPSDDVYKLSLPPTEINDFLNGMFHAQYLLRSKLRAEAKEFPKFSSTTITTFNKDLFDATDNLEEYFTQQEAPFLNPEGQETLDQTTKLLNYTAQDNPMAVNGATYMIGLFEKQQWISEITKQTLSDSLPENVKKDLVEMNSGEPIIKEYSELIKDSVLENSIISLEKPSGLSIFKTIEEDTAPKEGSTTEPKISHLVGVQSEDYGDFLIGVIAAHYLIRSLDGSAPQFSQDWIDRHNLNLAIASKRQEGGVYRYLNEDMLKKIGNERVEQISTILSSTGDDNDMSKTGGLYLLSLYESQKEVNGLNMLFNPQGE